MINDGMTLGDILGTVLDGIIYDKSAKRITDVINLKLSPDLQKKAIREILEHLVKDVLPKQKMPYFAQLWNNGQRAEAVKELRRLGGSCTTYHPITGAKIINYYLGLREAKNICERMGN